MITATSSPGAGRAALQRFPPVLDSAGTTCCRSGMAAGDAIDLTIAAPLPGPGVLAAYQRATAELPAHLSGTGYSPSGLPVLRAAVAAAYEARGLPTSPTTASLDSSQ